MFQLIKGYLDSDVNGGREDLRTKHLQAQASGEEMPREGADKILEDLENGGEAAEAL